VAPIGDKAPGTYAASAAFAGDYTRGAASGSASLVVPNTAPSAGALTWSASVEPVIVRTTVTATVPYVDPDAKDKHTVKLVWGDGTSSTGTVDAAAGTGRATHAFAAPGLYSPTATVTDMAGASSTSPYGYVAAVDPSAGYLVGGGSMSSPAGAYTAKPSLAGSATITQLYARYAADGTMNNPSNIFKFAYTTGGFNYAAYTLNWLVISGTTATLRGYGYAITGGVSQGAYFLLSVVDGNPDKVRVKIWNKTTVFYDNQKNADGSSPPDTVLATRPTTSFGTVSFRK
jgi:large repetitive protein